MFTGPGRQGVGLRHDHRARAAGEQIIHLIERSDQRGSVEVGEPRGSLDLRGHAAAGDVPLGEQPSASGGISASSRRGSENRTTVTP